MSLKITQKALYETVSKIYSQQLVVVFRYALKNQRTFREIFVKRRLTKGFRLPYFEMKKYGRNGVMELILVKNSHF